MTFTQTKILKNALYKAQLIELDYIDTLPKYDISNSEKINNSIKEISEGLTTKKKRISNKLVFILVAAIITITMAMSISAIRKPILNFFTSIYESFITIFVEADEELELPTSIEQMYILFDIFLRSQPFFS